MPKRISFFVFGLYENYIFILKLHSFDQGFFLILVVDYWLFVSAHAFLKLFFTEPHLGIRVWQEVLQALVLQLERIEFLLLSVQKVGVVGAWNVYGVDVLLREPISIFQLPCFDHFELEFIRFYPHLWDLVGGPLFLLIVPKLLVSEFIVEKRSVVQRLDLYLLIVSAFVAKRVIRLNLRNFWLFEFNILILLLTEQSVH